MTIQVQAQINGGAQQTGAVTVAAGDVVQLSLVSAAGAGPLLWEIFSHPTNEAGSGYALPLPTGWTLGADGHTYFSEEAAPDTVTIPAAPYWGKVLVRCTPGGNALAKDESLVLTMLSPLGLEDLAPLESNQADPYRAWGRAAQNNLRLIGAGAATGAVARSILWDVDNPTDATLGRYATMAEVAAIVEAVKSPVTVQLKGAIEFDDVGTHDWSNVTIIGNSTAVSGTAAVGAEGVIIRDLVRWAAPISVTTSATTTRLFEFTAGHSADFESATLEGNASVGLIRANHSGEFNAYFDGVTFNRNTIETTTTTTVNAYVKGGSFAGSSSGHVKGTTGTLNLRTDDQVTGTYDSAAFSGTENFYVTSNPTKIADVTVSGAPTTGQVLTATSSSAATWQDSAGGGAVTPATDANTLIWFPLDDAAGTTSIANAGTGSAFSLPNVTGTLTFGVPTPTGDGLMVIGVSYLDNSSGTALTYQPATTAMTVSCWVEFPNPNTVATSSTLWSKPNGASDATFAILVDTSGAARVFSVAAKVATTGVITSGPVGYATPGQRYFIVATFDASSMRTYINGVLAATTTAVGNMSWDNTKSFTVGALGTADTYVLSDCRLENVVRTLTEIKAAYNAGAFTGGATLDAATLQGEAISATTPTTGQALVYDGAAWTPTAQPTRGVVASLEWTAAAGVYTIVASENVTSVAGYDYGSGTNSLKIVLTNAVTNGVGISQSDPDWVGAFHVDSAGPVMISGTEVRIDFRDKADTQVSPANGAGVFTLIGDL